MKKSLAIVLSGVMAACFATAANATIIGGTVTGGTAFDQGGVFEKLTAPLSNPFGDPNSVGDDTFQSPNLFGFDEDQNVILPIDLGFEEAAPGGTLLAGTEVASHYIFFDPAGGTTIVGTVEFDSVILAIMTSTETLLASDILANTGVNYLNPGLRGLESGDFVTIISPTEILIDFFAATPGDYIRVLTAFSPAAEVPEPATLGLFAIGLAMLGFIATRRRRVAVRANPSR